jgi:hypothetical protein
MFLYTYIHVNPFNFLKKYGNHCTLMEAHNGGTEAHNGGMEAQNGALG